MKKRLLSSILAAAMAVSAASAVPAVNAADEESGNEYSGAYTAFNSETIFEEYLRLSGETDVDKLVALDGSSDPAFFGYGVNGFFMDSTGRIHIITADRMKVRIKVEKGTELSEDAVNELLKENGIGSVKLGLNGEEYLENAVSLTREGDDYYLSSRYSGGKRKEIYDIISGIDNVKLIEEERQVYEDLGNSAGLSVLYVNSDLTEEEMNERYPGLSLEKTGGQSAINSGYTSSYNIGMNEIDPKIKYSTFLKMQEDGLDFHVLCFMTAMAYFPDITYRCNYRYYVADVEGDANSDSDMNLADAIMIMQTLANPDKYTMTEQGRRNADLSGTGDGISSLDAQTIQKRLLRLE